MEFPLDLHSNIVVEPKDTHKSSMMPAICAQATKFTWKNKHDVLYVDGMGSPVFVDGMNSAGTQYAI